MNIPSKRLAVLCATVHQQPHICRESPFTHTCLYMIRSHLIYQLFKISTQCLLQWKSNNGCINLYSLAYIYLQISEGIIPSHLSLHYTKELMDLSLITSCNNRWITQSYVLTACQRRPTYMYMCCIQYRNWGQSFDISCIFLVTLHSTLATFFFEQYATRMGGFAYIFYEIAACCGLPKQIPIVLRGYIMAYDEMHGL